MATKIQQLPSSAAVQGGERRPALLYMVKQLELAVRSRLDDILKPGGITALQYTALTVLDRHDGLSVAELARSSFVTPQSMADMVGNLANNGHIKRERNPDNRRELILRLTLQGRQLLARFADDVRELEQSMTVSMTHSQIEEFRANLNLCRKALNKTQQVSIMNDRPA